MHHRIQRGTTDDAERLQQQCPASPDPGAGRHSHRDGSRRPHRPPEPTPAFELGHPAMGGQFTWPLGTRYARGRDAKLHREDQFPRNQREAAADRALHTNGRRHTFIRVHHRRSNHLHATLDGPGSDDQDSQGRSTSMRATRATTVWPASSRVRDSKSGLPPLRSQSRKRLRKTQPERPDRCR